MKEKERTGAYLIVIAIIVLAVLLAIANRHHGIIKTEKPDTVSFINYKRVIEEKKQEYSLPPLNDREVYKELVRQEVKHPKIVLAQARLETGHYKSSICKSHNNLFGIRRGKGYRYFNHWTESITYYKEHVQSRYEGGDYYDFLDDIGYAEADDYTEALKRM